VLRQPGVDLVVSVGEEVEELGLAVPVVTLVVDLAGVAFSASPVRNDARSS
jgi:hypothetical protein